MKDKFLIIFDDWYCCCHHIKDYNQTSLAAVALKTMMAKTKECDFKCREEQTSDDDDDEMYTL